MNVTAGGMRNSTAVSLVQSVSQRLCRGWTSEGLELESRQGTECSLLSVVGTGSEAFAASYPMGTVSTEAGA
jgi:hypothetical protein